ncbi:unnamed protein product [Linum tenue]|uniref:Uncharacterized protein n=1 Tax=Linum tenue TaxID=586396 RepID=A0AAV0JZ01_9ROSI|nr:unnamed protein product [Linum tenue]
MKSIGLQAYRFSLSWDGILPNGTVEGGPNQEGIEYYNNLINELLVNGVKPFVTIFHFDLPEALKREYVGFLSPKVVKDFVAYADVCFKHFGDRVQHWVTINEPLSYSLGMMAPGQCSKWMNLNCTGGDSATEPYIVAHNLLLAHATTVKLYREKYQAIQKGKTGTAHVSQWGIPLSDSKQDHKATRRGMDFMLGWFMDPLATGNYPRSMRAIMKKQLPKFSKEESKMLKGSFDFVGLNYYTTFYVSNAPPSNPLFSSSTTDSRTNASRKQFTETKSTIYTIVKRNS